MAVDDRNGVWIGYGDVIRLYAHQRSKRLMSLVHREIASSPPALIEQPEVAKDCELRTRNVPDGIVSNIW